MLAQLIAIAALDTGPVVVPPAPPPPPSLSLVLTSDGCPDTVWHKFAAEVRFCRIDFTAELAGDTITGTPTLSADCGATVTSASVGDSGSTVSFWLSGGGGPALGYLTCLVATTGGQLLEGKVTLQIAA